MSAAVTGAANEPAARSTSPPRRGEARDGSRAQDFAAMLGASDEASTPAKARGRATAEDASPSVKPDAPTDADRAPQKDRDADDDARRAAPADAGDTPPWLLALRQSLNLGTAATPAMNLTALASNATTGDATTDARKTRATTSAPPAATTDAAAAPVTLGEALASVDATLPLVDHQTPTDDQHFDALLSAMATHDGSSTAAASTLATTLAASAPAASTHPTAATSAMPPMTLPPDHPPDQSRFVDSLGERIVWVAGAGLDHAQIELHPAELGCLSVRVEMRGDTARVSFAADNPATRALLNDSLPQLRELMSAQGLQLLRTQVESRVSASRGSDTAFSSSRDGRGDADDAQGSASVRRITRLELVDAYV